MQILVKLDGSEIAQACMEYLARRNHPPCGEGSLEIHLDGGRQDVEFTAPVQYPGLTGDTLLRTLTMPQPKPFAAAPVPGMGRGTPAPEFVSVTDRLTEAAPRVPVAESFNGRTPEAQP